MEQVIKVRSFARCDMEVMEVREAGISITSITSFSARSWLTIHGLLHAAGVLHGPNKPPRKRQQTAMNDYK
jgi:hypothetical protein